MDDRHAAQNPEPVYLCQVGPHISCGACCGLYNVADASRDGLDALLTRRTCWFAEVPRTVAGLDAFKARVEAAEDQARPFPDFHHCPFLGMIADGGRRVGCLLHPLGSGNGSIDWRGLSYYGGMACRTYFCPSVRHLPARWLAAVRESMDHWYLHGLIVTERRLLTAFFTEVERRIGRPIDAADFSSVSPSAELFRRFASLKVDWPHRRPGAPGVCNYFFEDGLYPRPAVKRVDASVPVSALAVILEELDSGLSPTTSLSAAETRIERIIADLAATLGEA